MNCLGGRIACEDDDALFRFVTKGVDYCAEENIEMTTPALEALRPVQTAIVRTPISTTRIYQSGYNCCGIFVACISRR